MKIGLLTPAWPGTRTPNGIATAVRHLAGGLAETGHEVTILALKVDAPHDTPRVVEVGPLPWTLGDKLRARLGQREAVAHRAVARGLAAGALAARRAHGIDVLIMEETQGWASVVAPALPVPVVVTLHGPWFLHKRLQSRGTAAEDAAREKREAAGLAAAAGIAAPSRDVLEATQAHLDLPDVPQAVIANPIPCPPLPTAGPPPGSILFIGRFDRHKGGDVVIDAFARLAERHPQARLTFAGPDRGVTRPGRPDLHLPEALAALPEAARARIDWRGSVGQDEIGPLRAAHAVTVIASRYENLNYTLLEALAAGAAIVCSDVGGPGDVLSDGETALLVPPEDPAALAAALGRVLDDPGLAARLSANARALAETRFAPRRIAAETVAFLERLAAG